MATAKIDCSHCGERVKGDAIGERFCSTVCRDAFAKAADRRCLWCDGVLAIGWSFAAWECATVCEACRRGTKPDAAVERFTILQRDEFQCAYCGASPRTSKAVLHIDHIVPLSRDGGNWSGNLITACDDCNMAKSNHRLDPKVEEELLQIVEDRNNEIGLTGKEVFTPGLRRMTKRIEVFIFEEAR